MTSAEGLSGICELCRRIFEETASASQFILPACLAICICRLHLQLGRHSRLHRRDQRARANDGFAPLRRGSVVDIDLRHHLRASGTLPGNVHNLIRTVLGQGGRRPHWRQVHSVEIRGEDEALAQRLRHHNDRWLNGGRCIK